MTNTDITKTELEEVSDEKITKISISWILNKRNWKSIDNSPPEKNKEETINNKENSSETNINKAPKLKLSALKINSNSENNTEKSENIL